MIIPAAFLWVSGHLTPEPDGAVAVKLSACFAGLDVEALFGPSQSPFTDAFSARQLKNVTRRQGSLGELPAQPFPRAHRSFSPLGGRENLAGFEESLRAAPAIPRHLRSVAGSVQRGDRAGRDRAR